MKASYRVGLVALSLFALAACKREAPVAPATDATPAATAANPVDATSVVDNTAAPVAATLDTKALAGQFGNGESVLELRADGTYLQTLWVAGSEITADGSWSPRGEKALLLDPNSKSAEDTEFQVVSTDELRSSDGKHVFRRISKQ